MRLGQKQIVKKAEKVIKKQLQCIQMVRWVEKKWKNWYFCRNLILSGCSERCLFFMFFACFVSFLQWHERIIYETRKKQHFMAHLNIQKKNIFAKIYQKSKKKRLPFIGCCCPFFLCSVVKSINDVIWKFEYHFVLNFGSTLPPRIIYFYGQFVHHPQKLRMIYWLIKTAWKVYFFLWKLGKSLILFVQNSWKDLFFCSDKF